MKRGRAQARRMWQAVADADFSRDVLLWVSNVGAAILAADEAPDDNERRAAVLHAVGLSGRLDPQREIIRMIVAGVDHTCTLIERGSRWERPRPLKRGERTRRRRDAVAEVIKLDGAKEIDERIRRALAD